MARRLSLPLSDALGADVAPTADVMRKRLGGRIAGTMSLATPQGTIVVGSFVDFATTESAGRKAGVLLTIEGDTADVYIAGGLVRRMRAEYLSPRSGVVAELVPIAESAAVYARLGEGQAVEVDRGEGDIQRGTLLEKCRYGALVKLAGDVVLAVGFRKVWPARELGLTN